MGGEGKGVLCDREAVGLAMSRGGRLRESASLAA